MAIQPPQRGCFPEHFPAPFQYTQELPLGRWDLMINGRVYWLDIQDVSLGGRVRADLSSGTVEEATWDGVGTAMQAGKLSFVRVEGDVRQQFEGWLFQYSQEDRLWRMAGTVEHLDKTKASSGWYGTLPRR